MSRRVLKSGAFVLLLLPVAVSAEDTPENIVKYRAAVMSSMAKHMKSTSMVVGGKVSVPGELEWHAAALAGAGKNLGSLWPEGSGPGKVESGSLETVWTTPEEFQQAVKQYQVETRALLELSKGSDMKASAAQFKKVGATCGGCHKAFRKDDD